MKKHFIIFIGVLLTSLAAFSQASAIGDKKLILKVRQGVNYSIDYENKKFILSGTEFIPAMNRLKGLQSVFRKDKPLPNGLVKIDLVQHIHFVHLPDDAEIHLVVALLKTTGLFEYVEADAIGSGAGVQIIPNDQYYSAGQNYQWYLKNNGVFSADANAVALTGADIKIEQAWNVTTGSSSTIICILDTGLKLDHPEFTGRLWVNNSEIPGNNIDDDGNG